MKTFPITSVTRWLLVVVGCVVLATAQPMSAASADAPPSREPGTVIFPKNSAESTSSKPPITNESDQSTRSLIIVVAFLLALGGAWVLIQRRQAGPSQGKGQRKLHIEESRPLGNKQYIVVASYQDKKFLLGITPGQIQLLSALSDSPAQETKP